MDVDPMARIMALRDKALEAGYTKSYGARHAEAFSRSVKRIGRIDELRLPIWTFGFFNIKELLKLVPTGIRALLAGKMPPLFHRSIPGQSDIRRIFERFEKKR